MPMGPVTGVKVVIVGLEITVKLAVLVAVPPGDVTEIVPVVAPVGTTAVMDVSDRTVKVVATVPLKETVVTPVSPVPVIVTVVPTGPAVGANDNPEGS